MSQNLSAFLIINIGIGISKLASIGIVILGIISFALGGLSIDQPMFAAILIGVALIIEGIGLYIE